MDVDVSTKRGAARTVFHASLAAPSLGKESGHAGISLPAGDTPSRVDGNWFAPTEPGKLGATLA